MLYDSMLECIGRTPLVRLRSVAGDKRNLFAKMELMNPFGMKDRFAYYGVLAAKAAGELADDDVIIESSSGTLALGLALVGRALQHEVHIVTDRRIDPLTLTRLRALGAVVHVVEQMSQKGWQGARLEKLHQLLGTFPSAFWPRQYSNPNNPLAYASLAQELISDLGRVDVLVGPVGSGGSLCGTARALRQHNPDLVVVAVDAVNSVIFDQPDNPRRLQSGLGNSLVPPNVDKSVIDQVHWLSDEEAFAATLRLAADEQIFAGNSSGSAYWVARWLKTQRLADDNIVIIFPDRGDRYHATFYNEEYRQAQHMEHLRLPDAPAEVPYTTPVSSWSYALMADIEHVCAVGEMQR